MIIISLTQEQQFVAQQKDSEEKTMNQMREQCRQKVLLMDRQVTEQKEQVQNGEDEW